MGKTEVRYQLRGLDDLNKMLKQRGDCMPLGSADELSTFRKATECELAEPAGRRRRVD